MGAASILLRPPLFGNRGQKVWPIPGPTGVVEKKKSVYRAGKIGMYSKTPGETAV